MQDEIPDKILEYRANSVFSGQKSGTGIILSTGILHVQCFLHFLNAKDTCIL